MLGAVLGVVALPFVAAFMFVVIFYAALREAIYRPAVKLVKKVIARLAHTPAPEPKENNSDVH